MEKKNAVVTGGSRGIGRAIALLLSQNGYRVITCSKSGGDVVCDVTKDQDVHRFVSHIRESVGHVDVLVNNAGGCAQRDYLFGDIPESEVGRVMRLNTESVINVTQAILPLVRPGGSIVNISTSLTKTPIPGKSLYAVSKVGLETLTRNMALELARDGIRVNCVCPGPTDTALLRGHFSEDGELDAESYANFARSLPFGELVSPEDVANLVVFLCSENARMVTGQIISVDGGRSLRW